MGNQHSSAHATHKPRKNVHWKSAGRPAAPGRPEIAPEEEPNAVTLRWGAAAHDGGAPLLGYQVECNRLGTPAWVRTAPPLVARPELVLSGLEPPHRYQFRVAAVNAVGRSEYSDLSEVLNVGAERSLQHPPLFLQHIEDVVVLENEKTEFKVMFNGLPTPTVAWFKDGYEIFSSRRTAITTDETSSVLLFHQTLASDEGEIKCTVTNRAGHAVSKARLLLEAAPKLRYPRQYEDGLLYEINETIFLKTSIVGKPTPTIEWRHDSQLIVQNDRVEITNTGKISVLKIQSARRSDRGEYQIHARNAIGEDMAAFLVTVTAPPDPPRHVTVTRQIDKSVSLDWQPPDDDGGCRIGNYVIEYYRTGWNVWLKATTSRKTSITLFDLIEGSEYRFRVKAESPYGMSVPSEESAAVRIPGRAVDMEFLAVEARIINDALLKEDGEEARVSPAPRRRRPPRRTSDPGDPSASNEFMLVLYPGTDQPAQDKAEKRKSFQLDLEDALSPPPISLSAPELSTRYMLPFKSLRNAVSSTELLHERAMARFYKILALKEEQDAKKQKLKEAKQQQAQPNNDIPHHNNLNARQRSNDNKESFVVESASPVKAPEIFIKSESVDKKEYKYNPDTEMPHNTGTSDNKWRNMSFEEDYTASTVSSDEELSDEYSGSLNGDVDRIREHHDEETYNPRDKSLRPGSAQDFIEEDEDESEREVLKPLPLIDPNFVPKPILKKRESDNIEVKSLEPEPKQYVFEKPKKEEKMTILRKITKMPMQKPFAFPKILNKKDSEKKKEQKVKEKPKEVTKTNDIDEVADEGRTVIDYYSNIVKEYGGQKKQATQLYLNTEDLKSVAEKQQQEQAKKEDIVAVKKPQVKKVVAKQQNKNSRPKSNTPNNSIEPPPVKQKQQQPVTPKQKQIKKVFAPSKLQEQKEKEKETEKATQQIVLKKTERATIVIPIDYQELEEKAKENVRSFIDYMVDFCLLLIAFWVYFFKDERLAIPFLVLIIYRQLQETLLTDAPQWLQRHTPAWLKRKTS